MQRIASFANTSTLLQQSLRIQSLYAKDQASISSGMKSTTYDGIATGTQTLLDIESSIAAATQYKANATTLQTRLETMYQAVGNLSDQIASALQTLTVAMGGDQLTGTEVSAYMQTALDAVASLLNTQLAGRYLFSGTMTGTAPVDISVLSAQIPPSSTDSSYYEGDGTAQSLRIAENQVISYGITANNSVFEQMIRGLNLAMHNPTDGDAISEAFDLLQQATEGLAAMQTQISAQSNAVDARISQQDAYLETAAEMASGIRNADTAALTVAISNREAQLEASFSVMTKLLSIKLTDYLR